MKEISADVGDSLMNSCSRVISAHFTNKFVMLKYDHFSIIKVPRALITEHFSYISLLVRVGMLIFHK